MAQSLINKYVWIADTIIRHKYITRNELNELWIRNRDLSEGKPMSRRTFFNYCRAIESTFGIDVRCNTSTYEYYIEQSDESGRSLRDWLFDSVAISDTLSGSKELSHRIVLENVPSAREHLPGVLEGIRSNNRLEIDYSAFDRVSTVTTRINPYFVRIFRQRWYVIGYDLTRKDIRTYALDRVKGLRILQEKFEGPDVTAAEYFRDLFGIYQSKGKPECIRIKADSSTAKYIGALPLHSSQQEEYHDKYSIFTYHMLVTPDLVQELLGMGARIEVLAPESLRARMVTELSAAIANYK